MGRPRKIITAEQALAAWEAEREYQREYDQRPYVKAKRREYQREYHQRPDVKAKRREYYQRPDVKAQIREYYRKEQIARLEAKLAQLRAEA